MKILYVINDTMKLGGTESVVLNYYYHINHEKIHIDFILHTTEKEMLHNKICNELLKSGAKIFCVTPRNISIKKNKQDIYNILKSNKYDAIHSHADCVSAYILKIAKHAGVKIRIAHSHSTKIPIKPENFKNILHIIYLEYCRKNICKYANSYMACSIMAGKWLFGKKNIINGKVYILKNAIDINKFHFDFYERKKIREKLSLQNNFVVGHVGRFSYEKNHEFLINVFYQIYIKNKNARLLLVGTGEYLEQIKNMVSLLKLENAVIFYGNSFNVNELLQAMDVFVFPSLYEGLSVVLVEAQANGLPCYVSDCKNVSKETCITDLIKMYKLSNPKEWADEIIAQKNQRQDYLKTIREKGYDICYEADKLEKYYMNLNQKLNYE